MEELDIRVALRSEAELIEVPADLALRTMEAAHQPASAWTRLRDRRGAPRTSRHRGTVMPRLAYAAMAVVLLAGFWFAGRATQPFGRIGGVSETSAESGDSRLHRQAIPMESDASGTFAKSEKNADPAVAADQSSADGRAPLGVSSGPDVAPQPVPPATNPGQVPPKLVRSATAEIKVKKGKFDLAWARANEVAAKHQGFVVSATGEQVKGNFARGTVVLRVPVAELAGAVADLRRIGTMTVYRTTANDVSGQLFDFDSRLRNLSAQELATLELMKQAKRVEDILQVRQSLDGVRTQIEQLKAQQAALQGQVDYSTITATIFEPDAAPAVEPRPGHFSFSLAWAKAVNVFLSVLGGILLVAAFVIPIGVVIAILVLVVRLVRRRSL